MPRRLNPPYMLPGDPGYRSEHDSQSLPSDAESYDEYGQPRGGGVGQGAPLDENGRYIYSQAGMPILASPSPSSPHTGPHAAQENLLSPGNSDNMPADAALGHTEVNRPCLKRGWCSDDADDSLPQTPCHLNTAKGLFALGTSRLVNTMPSLPSPRAPKRRRLRAPFSISTRLQTSHMESLEETMKELQKDVRSMLVKQTEILAEILDVLREGNSKN
ncbi:hypothetical protein JVT61DRAFT_11849 [Boletus reticuloceps]|uniref:Uncharacterized protein n=1 Tax=Boletus reticuloceps TaxID=495285 RepID=A0A8I2YUB0_9AGAM|nr:hypothetical protein JVT61DRAFT_11849 [Boletus reticuloceps]